MGYGSAERPGSHSQSGRDALPVAGVTGKVACPLECGNRGGASSGFGTPLATSQLTQSASTKVLAIPPLTARCHQHSPMSWRGHYHGDVRFHAG